MNNFEHSPFLVFRSTEFCCRIEAILVFEVHLSIRPNEEPTVVYRWSALRNLPFWIHSISPFSFGFYSISIELWVDLCLRSFWVECKKKHVIFKNINETWFVFSFKRVISDGSKRVKRVCSACESFGKGVPMWKDSISRSKLKPH